MYQAFRSLLKDIEQELDVGQGAAGYDWRRARDLSATLHVWFIEKIKEQKRQASLVKRRKK